MVSLRKRKRVGGVRWVVAWRDPDGRQRLTTCATKEQAELVRARKVQELGGGRHLLAEDLSITVRAYATRWLQLVGPSVKPSTYLSYEAALRRHLVPAFGDRRVRDLTRQDVKDLVTRKLTEGRAPRPRRGGGAEPSPVVARPPLSRNSVRILHATLHAMLNEAVEDGIIQANPAARRGRTRILRLTPSPGDVEEQVKAMTGEELGAFLAAALRTDAHYYPLVVTMARTGMRIGEVLGLQWQDVDLAGSRLRIARAISGGLVQTPKNGRPRTVDMSPVLRDVLTRLDARRKAEALKAGRALEGMAPWVFPSETGGLLDRNNIRERVFRRILKAAGLSPHFTPHCLRHTYASLLLQAGASPVYVQRQLGHQDIRLTVNLYGRWLRIEDGGAGVALDKALSGEVVTDGDRSGPSEAKDLPQVVGGLGGPRGDRTPDLLIANQALSQLS